MRKQPCPLKHKVPHAQGLPALLTEDPVAQGPVLEMLLLPHFRQLLELDPALHPPLKLEKCAAISQARTHALLLRRDAHATKAVEACRSLNIADVGVRPPCDRFLWPSITDSCVCCAVIDQVLVAVENGYPA